MSRIDKAGAVGYFDINFLNVDRRAEYAAGGRRVMTVPESIIAPADENNEMGIGNFFATNTKANNVKAIKG